MSNSFLIIVDKNKKGISITFNKILSLTNSYNTVTRGE